MAIRQIRRVPTDLPFAVLYLDDLEEISAILIRAGVAAVKVRQEENAKRFGEEGEEYKPPETKVLYQIGKAQIETIAELADYTQSAREFIMTVSVGEYEAGELTFSKHPGIEPSLEIGFIFTGDERWALYAKIESVVERRTLSVKNTLLSLPSWVGISTWFLLTFTPVLALAFHFPLNLFLYVLWVVAIVIVLYVMLRPSRVYFVRSHEQSKLRASARQEFRKHVGYLIVGAVLGGFITKLIDVFFTHYRH
jgi:hypothetical protein